MEKISISEVSKRRRSLENKKRKKDLSLLLNKEKLTLKEAQEVIENFTSINDDHYNAFEYVLNIFKEGYSNNYTCKNDLELQRLCNTVCGIMPRLETTDSPVYDLILKQSRESRNFVKRTMRNAKKYAERSMDPEEGSIPNKDYNNHIKDPKEFPPGYQVKTLKSAPTKDSFSNISGVSGGKVEECYNQIQETAKRISICDRVLYNHNKMSKRFNLNNVVEESKDFECCVYELCQLIDSYDIPFDIKYNVALENISYLFDLNHKYQGNNPKEFIDEFFYAKDLEPENVKFMESITEENPFYFEDKKVVKEEKVNEFSSILEISNENPVKKLIDDFKKDNNKTSDKGKALVNKIYTKSPQQIIDGTPNFLSWLRTFAVFSTLAINVPIGLLALFTDKMIELHLRRKETEKILKTYESEIEKTKKKIDKTNSKETKERLTKYCSELESQYKTLKEYRDSLRTEKELDDEWEINETCLAEGIFDKISIGYELENIKNIIRFEFKKALEKLKIASKNKFKTYFDKGYFKFVGDEEVEEFLTNFDKEVGRYIDAGGNICMNLCYCNFEELFEQNDDIDYFKIIDELVAFCSSGASDKVSISYEGTGGNMYIIFTYLEPLYIEAEARDEIRESCFHPMSYDSIGTILELSDIIDTFKFFPRETFIDNLLKADLSVSEVKTLIEYFSDTSVFSLDESVMILNDIKNKSEGKDSQNISYFINKFIKESVNIPEQRFNLTSFKEDVEMFKVVYEAVEDKNNNMKDKVSNSMDNIKDKLRSAMSTVKLGGMAGKRKVKELDSKQKQISKEVDDTLSSMVRRIEDASVSKSREQIIKGSILPSASKVIKTAVTVGGAYLINPAIAVIGALSMLFMSKNATKRERALILDEIDIELKIVERKISRAESEDDDDNLRELYKIQNKLRREKQRLKYRMDVYYHQKPISANPKGDEE